MPYRRIDCEIWVDDKFPFASDDAQVVWFHAFTYLNSTSLGIYCASIEALAADKNKNGQWSLERYRKGFEEGLRKGFLKYDERFQVVYFPKFFKANPINGEKRNKPSNPNQLKGMLKCWNQIPDSELKQELYHNLTTLAKGWGEGFTKVMKDIPEPLPNVAPNLSETFRKVSRNSKQEQDQKQEQDPQQDSVELQSSSSITEVKGEKQNTHAAAASGKEKTTSQDYIDYLQARGLTEAAVTKPSCLAMFMTWESKSLSIDELKLVINPIVQREKGKVTSPMYFKQAIDEYLANRKPSNITKHNKNTPVPVAPKCLTQGCNHDSNFDGYCVVCYDAIRKQNEATA